MGFPRTSERPRLTAEYRGSGNLTPVGAWRVDVVPKGGMNSFKVLVSGA